MLEFINRAVKGMDEPEKQERFTKEDFAKDMSALTTALVGLSLYHEISIGDMLLMLERSINDNKEQIYKIFPELKEKNLL